jgi:hypothetical protein
LIEFAAKLRSQKALSSGTREEGNHEKLNRTFSNWTLSQGNNARLGPTCKNKTRDKKGGVRRGLVPSPALLDAA